LNTYVPAAAGGEDAGAQAQVHRVCLRLEGASPTALGRQRLDPTAVAAAQLTCSSSPSSLPTRHAPRAPQLGTYDPIAQHLDGIKEVRLRLDRIKYWLSVGGQPSDRVGYLLWRAGIAPAPPVRWQTQYNKNKKELRAAAKKGFHTLAAGVYGGSAVGAAATSPLAAAARRQPLGLFAGLLSAPAGAPLQALR
jgi:ribosomal protein S16